ncbi:uncharacterized protein ACR2FA_010672 [Aphomia sociella]
MSDTSDIEMKSALPKETKKPKQPKSPSEDLLKHNKESKKLSTKEMVREALIELKSRKGTSLYAIKKYISEKYNVDTEKNNYIIKKQIKSGVESGAILQMKGIGASGSFKLVTEKKIEKKPKAKKVLPKKKTDKENPKKKEKIEKNKEKTEEVKKKIKKVTVPSKDMSKEKMKKTKTENPKNKMAKEKQTPAKKRAAMLKRKSIGSIIKPPKMKPKKN